MASPRTETIEHVDDPRIAGYRLIRERDLAGREGLFVAEGEVVLRHLVASPRFRPASVLIERRRLDRLAPMLAGLPDDVPVYLADQDVMNAIAGFDIHRGVLGLGLRGEPETASELVGTLPPRALVVALYGIANHDNMGAILRNAAAFGADAVVLDDRCCDPLYRKALRVSVGAALIVPFARLRPGEDALGLLADNRFEAVALTPTGASRLRDLRPADRTALLFGAEGPGLPPAVIARARAVRIPMAQGFDSLNVATASGIVLHHLRG